MLTINDFASAVDLAYKILQDSKEAGIQIISILDEHYPKLLKDCDDAPIILNYIGDISSLNAKPTIAIVGTRNPSDFGLKYTNHVASFFATRGFIVISGLAIGIDAVAHLSAIDSPGITCAVLAHGLDSVYPKENIGLADRIKKNGLIISEYFIGTTITKRKFIERNRIQAALASAVIIIECEVNSGTMHTANYAVSYDRILTCMKPPLEHFKQTKVGGNQMLTRTGKAVGIYEDSDLYKLSVLLSSNKI